MTLFNFNLIFGISYQTVRSVRQVETVGPQNKRELRDQFAVLLISKNLLSSFKNIRRAGLMISNQFDFGSLTPQL